ncbi:(2Fe-2S)-binding protein [Streptomyces sp. 15-116A]|uniref:(2Fe-2S)-binding protein n=1 Tax=Streptomyces sp. 15-116A TaxID=2259035 RepID=UPI0021B42288|nr:(2Fe-2S)-binding protein [Streptomyces sp. 15-116A]MCT7357109.1 (2Fe-2S)-binding protein [Streptomyces sp. 15-116A]
MVTEALTPGALERISAIGPYFALATGPSPRTHGFRPMTDLYGDPEALEDCVRAVAGRLGTDLPRVAASTLHLGTASRLWSVSLACAALTGRVPDLAPGRLWWRMPASGPLDLWLDDLTAVDGEPLAALHHTVAVRNLTPWADAVRRASGVSPHTLRGNAASALIGAHRVLLSGGPRPLVPVVPLVGALLELPPLAGAGTHRATPTGQLAFRRRSCCLYYRVPGAGTCGDCVLNAKERTTS